MAAPEGTTMMEVFFSPGGNALDSCVYSLLGRDLAMSLLPCAGGRPDGVRRARLPLLARRRARQPRAAVFLLQRPMDQIRPRCRPRSSRPTATRCSGALPRVRAVYRAQLCGRGRQRPPGQDRGKFTHERAVFDAVLHGARAALRGGKRP